MKKGFLKLLREARGNAIWDAIRWLFSLVCSVATRTLAWLKAQRHTPALISALLALCASVLALFIMLRGLRWLWSRRLFTSYERRWQALEQVRARSARYLVEQTIMLQFLGDFIDHESVVALTDDVANILAFLDELCRRQPAWKSAKSELAFSLVRPLVAYCDYCAGHITSVQYSALHAELVHCRTLLEGLPIAFDAEEVLRKEAGTNQGEPQAEAKAA